MKDYNADIGNWLRKARELRGLNQQDVADHFGVTKTAVSYWENGDRTITAETMIEYCLFLNVDPQDLVREVLGDD